MAKTIFQTILTLTLFSLWACFALTIVNQLFYNDLPGYTIGRICIWEVVALIVSFLIMKLMIRKWGTIEVQPIGHRKNLVMNSKYGVYFALYFLIMVLIGIWQFWRFSQNF